MLKRLAVIVFALFISTALISACGSKPAADQPEAGQPADSASQQEHPAEHPAEHPQDTTKQN